MSDTRFYAITVDRCRPCSRSVRPIYETHRSWNFDEFRKLEHSSQALKVMAEQQSDVCNDWSGTVGGGSCKA